MGYNKADYIRIREEFSKKYIRARDAAEARRREIHIEIPEIFEIDRVLSGTGMEIMGIITAGGGNTSERVAQLEARNNALIEKRGRILEENGYPPDHTDIHYECDKCGDTGYVDTVMCDCMKRALARAGYESSGLGHLIGKQTFDNFDYKYYPESSRPVVERGVGMLRSFAEGFNKDTYCNFIITGTTGLGKTHVTTAVAQTVIDKGFDVLYVSAVSMLGDFEQRRFGNSASISNVDDISRYYEADLLIIDDLGTEVVNKFTQSYFYEVINARINARKSTIINTNLTATEIETTYYDRISSRIFGEYQPIRFKGVDIRKQKTQ
ncbi:MAG: ATP-binding protein [Clostridia bacterium]|nr:ATP-binding protein [Clostridia bacterium]